MRGTQNVDSAVPSVLGIIPAHAGNTGSPSARQTWNRDHPRACGEHSFASLTCSNTSGSSPRMRGTLPTMAPRRRPRRDHPRACGEHGFLNGLKLLLLGSSPRMRGTPINVPAELEARGIIPAHAGNTSIYRTRLRASRDHPRACGEHDLVNRHRLGHLGSSPRMRGTLSATEGDRANLGIIPAHAGNTFGGVTIGDGIRDHPRACGEHRGHAGFRVLFRGSSPRMRGTLDYGLHVGKLNGIIPAHAGNTLVTPQAKRTLEDHPRACGEHHAAVCERGHELGIIPAHAGNTIRLWSCPYANRDHPRACGEHFAMSLSVNGIAGSSPRMRGTLARLSLCPWWARIIPAHAGNTLWTIWPRNSTRDHPRACGEHQTQVADRNHGKGSSPRMRGTPASPAAIAFFMRIIPAHAGNTIFWRGADWRVGDHPRACGEHLRRERPP